MEYLTYNFSSNETVKGKSYINRVLVQMNWYNKQNLYEYVDENPVSLNWVEKSLQMESEQLPVGYYFVQEADLWSVFSPLGEQLIGGEKSKNSARKRALQIIRYIEIVAELKANIKKLSRTA